MFRELRRKEMQLDEASGLNILEKSNYGILGVHGDDGYPYAVPVNYTYLDGKVYIHCAIKGHKIDAIRGNDKVSFTVVDYEVVLPYLFNTEYASVIAFGRARLLVDGEEPDVDYDGSQSSLKERVLESILKKLSPDFLDEGSKIFKEKWKAIQVIEITIEHLAAKGNAKRIEQLKLAKGYK
jgi:nitroimidazol reductase NimA-like FMN-containing flavoprotein (pyridoxamine 5'-phosphate oxidase superfamily)